MDRHGEKENNCGGERDDERRVSQEADRQRDSGGQKGTIEWSGWAVDNFLQIIT